MNRKFSFRFQPDPRIQAPTEIYLPKEMMTNSSLKVSATKFRYEEKEEVLRIWNNAEREISIELNY